MKSMLATRPRPAVDGQVAPWQLPFQPRHGGRLHNVSVEPELLGQLGLPLIAKMCRAQHRESPDDAAIEQLARDQRRLDRLTHADIIGNHHADRVELQRQQQRDELIRPWGDRDTA